VTQRSGDFSLAGSSAEDGTYFRTKQLARKRGNTSALEAFASLRQETLSRLNISFYGNCGTGVDKGSSGVFLLCRNCFIYKLIKTNVCLWWKKFSSHKEEMAVFLGGVS
jgi:hypothetical protein